MRVLRITLTNGKVTLQDCMLRSEVGTVANSKAAQMAGSRLEAGVMAREARRKRRRDRQPSRSDEEATDHDVEYESDASVASRSPSPPPRSRRCLGKLCLQSVRDLVAAAILFSFALDSFATQHCLWWREV